jgi:hypothetical protein
MYGYGKSDSLIVLEKPSNNGRGAPRFAERVEGRRLAKGNSVEQIRGWTQCQVALSSAFNGVRQEARLNLHVMTQGRSRMR